MTTYETWKIRANRDLSERFGIDFIDAGFDEKMLSDGFATYANPIEWVTWVADKYGMEEI